MDNALSLVTADDARPAQWMLVLHGILGRASNLRTITRRVAMARPAWGFALVDVRNHGGSQGFPPPHTVDSAAEDLLRLDARVPGPIRGVLGHSFGGKVALAYLARRGDRLLHAFDLDASPSARPIARDRSATPAIVEILERLPPVVPSREVLVEQVAALAPVGGASRSLGEWLAMNLERRGDGYSLTLDMRAIRAMLDDYTSRDLWPVVERVPGMATLHLIIGARGGAFTDEDRARLRRAELAQPGRIEEHELATGHWVHAEDPKGVIRIVTEALAQ